MKRDNDFSKTKRGKLCRGDGAATVGRSLNERVDLLLPRGLEMSESLALDRATLLERWRDLPPVDPEILRDDIDVVLDSTL